MRIDKKKVLTLFALTLLIASLLLVNMNGPTSATSPPAASGAAPAGIEPPSPPPEDLELHPREVVDLEDPFILGTQWHELYTDRTRFYQITDWTPGNVLSPEDMVYMYGLPFIVDDVTIDIEVTDLQTGTLYWLDYECGYWTFDPENPICTKWNEIKNSITHNPPYPPRCWHLTEWFDNGDGRLSFCDDIAMTPIDFYGPGIPVLFHVEKVTVTLKLTEYPEPPPGFGFRYLEFMGTLEEFQAMDYIHWPLYTMWYEIWPYQGTDWQLVEWIDQPFLSPSDQILLTLKDEVGQPIPGTEAEYHVDKLTVAMNLTSEHTGMEHIVKFEGSLRQFKRYHWIEPFGTQWHEVSPTYCRQWYLTDWLDQGSLVLDYDDYIYMMDKETGILEQFYVESLSTDMWVTRIVRDVAVIGVASRKAWVYQGGIDPIDVTVTNLGDVDESVVDVYAFYDGNLAAPKQTISLGIGETNVLTFNWDTTGVPPGFYTVSANATIPVDDDLTNNYLEGNVQEVRELPPPPLTADLELHPRKVVDIGDPTGTQWHELHPSRTNFYQVVDWTPGNVLGPEDIVYMNGLPFIVDDVTIDIEVLDEQMGITYWLDYECGYWTFDPENPVCTKWNEIKNSITHNPPYPPRCWHLTEWFDNGDGRLSFCDYIVMTPNDPSPGLEVYFHVEKATVTLKLTQSGIPPGLEIQYYLEFMDGTLEEFQAMDYIHSPLYTMWYVIWPYQGLIYELVEWIDQPFLSPSDQILLTLKDEVGQPIPGTEAEYHVDKLTVAMNLTSMDSGMEHIVKFEGSLRQFKQYYWVEPFGTQWHEVSPTYCRQWYLTDWLDQGSLVLDYGDYIYMVDKETGDYEEFHVESLSTDMWVTRLVRDVAVTNVTPSRPFVFQGCNMSINVTVENQGDYTETFNVTAYANTTAIQTLNVTNLPPGNSTTLTFTRNTINFAIGDYTISANATIVPGEIDTEDNTLTDGWVRVIIKGDLGSGLPPTWCAFDGQCNYQDLSLFRQAYLYSPQPPLPAPYYLADLGSGLPPKWCAFDDQCNYQDLTLFREAYLA